MKLLFYRLKLALLYFFAIIGSAVLILGIAAFVMSFINRTEDTATASIGFIVIGVIILTGIRTSIRKLKRDFILRSDSSLPVNHELKKNTTSITEVSSSHVNYSTTLPTPASYTPPSQEAEYDHLLPQAAEIVIIANQGAASLLQRRLGIGYSHAARLIDQLEEIGVVGPYEGSKPRKIMLTISQWRELQKDIGVSTSQKDAHEEDTKWNKIVENAILAEENWRREQRGLSPVEDEIYRIDHMEGHDFERWCATLLERNGFSDVRVTPGSNDQGVDVLAVKDSIKYAIQCKCYSSDLGNTPVQEVYAGKNMYDCHVGVVMTNRYFSSGAKAMAQKTGVLLWDRDKVTEMIKSML